MRTPLTIDEVQKLYARKGYIMTDFNIFGIRYFDNENLFTDVKCLLRKINGAWELHQWAQTTKPGLKALKQPMNGEGCGTLKEGQYINMWVIGYHKGVQDISHRALVQIPKSLSVYRDRERDGIIRYDADHIKQDGGGINHHSTWIGTKVPAAGNIPEHVHYDISRNYVYPAVDEWSEACQVMGAPKDQQEFMDMCEASGLKFFTYSLFLATDLQ